MMLVYFKLGVSKMVVDEDLIPMSGSDLIQQFARIPLLIGVAHTEWAHKKGFSNKSFK